MKKRLNMILFFVGICLLSAVTGAANNYVDWNGNFWLTVPDGWDKVDYNIVDQYLSMMDTSSEIYRYQALFAPIESKPFISGPYLVITFDSTGKLSDRESDSMLMMIARSYSKDVYNAPIVNLMTDLVPGQPKINHEQKTVSILTEMAYRPEAKKKLWQYMKFNDRGLITLYFYCPDSLYAKDKPVFDKVVQSLSFAGLREASGQGKITFTNVKGADSAASNIAMQQPEDGDSIPLANENKLIEHGSYPLYIALIVAGLIALYLLWRFVLSPKSRSGG